MELSALVEQSAYLSSGLICFISATPPAFHSLTIWYASAFHLLSELAGFAVLGKALLLSTSIVAGFVILTPIDLR